MGDVHYNWNDFPRELLIVVVHRLTFIENYIRFTSVCKSWKTAADEAEKPWLPPRCPLLLLAEEVAPAAIILNNDFDDNDEYCDSNCCQPQNNEEEEDDEEDDDDEEEEEEDTKEKETKTYYDWPLNMYDHRNNSVGITRGLYCLSTGKTYNIRLPEAAGRLILGTNTGWLVTLGRDLQINLLHPLFRHQVPLPPMLTLTKQYPCSEQFPPEDDSEMFIRKVAMSSRVPTNNSVSSAAAVVMAIYGECGFLSFARLGDEVWTDVNIPSRPFDDVIYHKGKFYAVDSHGNVFVCGIDDNKEKGGPRGIKIASFETYDWDKKYLVESSSGSGLLIVVRTYKQKFLKPPLHHLSKYRTTNFDVWKLELKYPDCLETPSATSIVENNNLGNEALFVGRASSVCVASSETIKPNCIYFTDDSWVAYYRKGGGHDMGIFNMKSGTIEPHFHEKSVHPISPPLWYN